MSDEEKPKWRNNYVAAPHYFNLNYACTLINRSFEGFGCCYLVGSSLVRKDYRDIDVRYIMCDAEYDRLFRGTARGADVDNGGWLNPLWSILCASISLWLSQQSGLPVDFQIQRQSQANADHPKGVRQPMGIFLDYPGERPSDLPVDSIIPDPTMSTPGTECRGCLVRQKTIDDTGFCVTCRVFR